MSIDNVFIPPEKMCASNANYCLLRGDYHSTPFIQAIREQSVVSGELVQMYGKFFTDKFEFSGSDEDVLIKRLYVAGGRDCEISTIELTNEQGHWGTLWCKPKIGTYIGRSNVSMIVSHHHGRSIITPEIRYIGPVDNDIYAFTFHALIEDIGEHSGSTEGGTRLKIKTKHAYNNEVTVSIGTDGVKCTVVPGSITEAGFECDTPADPQLTETLYPGNMGARLEIWDTSQSCRGHDEVLDWDENTAGFLEARDVNMLGFDSTVEYGTPRTFRYTGFLVPPQDGKYEFHLTSDDCSSIFLSTNSTEEGLRRVAYSRAYSGRNPWRWPEQTSEELELVGGTKYYMVAVLTNTGGHHAALYPGLLYKQGVYSASHTSAWNEKQRITVTSTIKRERQEVSKSAGGSLTDTSEVQTITVTSASGSGQFRIMVFSAHTSVLSYNADGNTVKTALNAVFDIYGLSGVTSVTHSTDTYTITFNSLYGDIPELSAMQVGDLPLTFATGTTTEGSPPSSANKFFLWHGGVPSAPINSGATAEEVGMALNDSYSARCPDELASLATKSAYHVAYYSGFEEDATGDSYYNYNDYVTDLDALCGYRSQLNPPYMFIVAKVKWAVDIKTHKHLCFGYKGIFLPKLVVQYEIWNWWTLRENELDITDKINVEDDNKWKYTCVNLYQLIFDYRGEDSISHLEVRWVMLKRPLDATEKYYFDHVTFARNSPIDVTEEPDATRRVAFPANSKGDLILGVNATETDTEYVIEFIPRNCFSPPVQLLQSSTSNAVSRDQGATGPVGGTFDLTFVAADTGLQETKTGLPADIEAKDLQRELQSMGTGDVAVQREGTCEGYVWIVEWTESGGNKELLQVTSHLTGEDVMEEVTTDNDGGSFYTKIPGEMIRTAYHDKPQVTVTVNGFPAKCGGNCDFEWKMDKTATVTSITPPQGPFNTNVTISGTNLESAVNTTTRVVIGGEECDVTGSTATSLQCTVKLSPVGQQAVETFIGGAGLASGTIQFTVQGAIDSVDPTGGNERGGNMVMVSGSGFTDGVAITIGGVDCPVKDTTPAFVMCEVPPKANSAGNTAAVAVTVGANTFTGTVNYMYNSDPIPLITALSTNEVSCAGNVTVTITGSTFGGTEPADAFVQVDEVDVTITSWSDTSIEATLPAHAPGSARLMLSLDGTDFVIPDTGVNLNITYKCKADSVSPSSGSLYGGTKLTITGEGFTTETSAYEIVVGETPCEVMSATATELQCDMETSTKTVINPVVDKGDDGFQWETAVVRLRLGDCVRWEWDTMSPGTSFAVHQTTDVTRQNRMGFSSGDSTSTGQFLYCFNEPDIYYVTSGLISETSSHQLFCTVRVEQRPSEAVDVSISINGYEVTYDSGGTPTPDASGCASVSTPLTGCTDPAPNCAGIDGLCFAFWNCATPTITALSANEADATQTITITGTGFSTDDCANKILVGEFPATVSSSAITSLSFTIDHQDTMTPGINNLVQVNVKNLGYAFGNLTDSMDQYLVFKPHITSISPTSGSIKGSTNFIITGVGFVPPLAVTIGDIPAELQSVNYTEIQANTYPSNGEALNQEVKVILQGPTGRSKRSSGSQGIQANCPGTCAFSFSSASTATVSSATTTDTSSPWAWNIAGTNFGATTTNADVTVMIGTQNCSVTAVSDTSITCSLDYGVVGDQPLAVSIADSGLADVSAVATVNIAPYIASVNPTSSGSNGGMPVSIVGGGFHTQDTSVSIGGVNCPISDISLSQLTCTAPPGTDGATNLIIISNGVTFPSQTFTYDSTLTPTLTSFSPVEGNQGLTLTIAGDKFSTTMSENMVTLADRECVVTVATVTGLECTLPVLPSGEHRVEAVVSTAGAATDDAVQPSTFNALLSVDSVSPLEGSIGGGTTVAIGGAGFGEDVTVSMCGELCEIVGTPTGSSVQCVTPAMTGNADVTCAVDLTTLGSTATSNDSFVFSAASSPILQSVTPKRGGTGGGTPITMAGLNFGATQGSSSVSINGIVCTVSSWSDTGIVCTTGRSASTVEAIVKVFVDGKGDAQVIAGYFYYVDLWSSVFTWGGGSLPVADDLVVVEAGHTILLDMDTPVLKLLLIKGGTLLFDDEKASITLRAYYVLITHGGHLQIGTEDNPYMNLATIELYGQLLQPELPLFGAKVIGLYEGTIDMHGAPIANCWTMLAATAAVGATYIVVEGDVSDWGIGSQLVLATTGGTQSQGETEVRNITSVNGNEIHFDEPLEYEHFGFAKEIGGHLFQFRAEVGLLTRNVRVVGILDSQFTREIEACPDGFDPGEFKTQTCFEGRFGAEEGSDQFGAHIFIFAHIEGLSEARFSYMELTNAGQAFRLARYAMHFHLMGDVTNTSYVRGSTVHRSFNRAINVHATQGLLVECHVAYNILGGAMFFEDGVEERNIFRRNLVIFARSSASLLNDDITPAGFWMTNPNNIIEYNHVVGGTHFGYWYRLHAHSDGPSFSWDICPNRFVPGSFGNNVAHSLGWYGWWIFQLWNPTEESACKGGTQAIASFYNFTAWNVGKCAESVHGWSIQSDHFYCVNAEKAGYELKFNDDQDEERLSATKATSLTNAVIVGQVPELDSDPKDPNMQDSYAGVIFPFDGAMIVDNVHLENMPKAFEYTSIDGTCGDDCAGRITQVSDVTTKNISQSLTAWRWQGEGIIHDMVGSLTGQTNKLVLPWTGGLPPSKCQKAPDNSPLNGKVPAAICDFSVGFARYSFNAFEPSMFRFRDVNFTNQYGSLVGKYQKHRVNHAEGHGLSLVTNEEYTLAFDDLEDNIKPSFANLSSNGKLYDIKEGDWVIIKAPMEAEPDYAIVGGKRSEDPVPTLGPNSKHGDWTFDPDNKMLGMMFKSTANTSKRKKRELPYTFHTIDASYEVVHCFWTDCIIPDVINGPTPINIRPDVFTRWNDWNNRPTAANQDLTVAEGEHIVLDQRNPPPFGNVYLHGTLDIEDQNTEITAKNIFIARGRLVAGYPTDPFAKTLTIKLKGTARDSDFTADGYDGPTFGSKAIINAGGLEFHGEPKVPTWTVLAATVNAGDNTITVEADTNWVAGDEIVIATSHYSSLETEVRTIRDVSNRGSTFTLTSPLDHKHLGETYTVGTRELSYKAEVGVLSRAITVQSEWYDNQERDSYGGRVLTTTVFNTEDGSPTAGYMRINQTRFKHMGQFGYTRMEDCRAALAVYSMRESSAEAPLIVTGSSFQESYSPGICLTDTDNVRVENNVFYRTVGSALMIRTNGPIINGNLMTLVVWHGSYQDRYEKANKDWVAGVEIHEATGVELCGNHVSGSERAGYRLGFRGCPAQPVPESEDLWCDNVARSTMIGVMILPDDVTSGRCTQVVNFDVYKATMWGFYLQAAPSIWIHNCLAADCGVGMFPFVNYPNPVGHVREDKEVRITDSALIGRSDAFDCDLDVLDLTDDSVKIARATVQADTGDLDGVGQFYSSFSGGTNAPLNMGFDGLRAYQTLSGGTTVTNTLYGQFREKCPGKRVVALTPDRQNDDLHFPIEMSGCTTVDTALNDLTYNFGPLVKNVNPSDCVDMECDCKKKLVTVDTDGGFLGSPGSIVSDAAINWDDDPRYGIGNYRIPLTAQVDADQNKIDISGWIPGIIRDSSCTLKSEWNAYHCGDTLNYRMVVLESMDADTESRRLSPVAIISDTAPQTYVDLVNGPMDHGWCAGYTCQKRLSIFPVVIATGHAFKIYMSGTAPQHLRMHFLHAEQDEKVGFLIYYATSSRLDVYVGQVYIDPMNRDPKNKDLLLEETGDEYKLDFQNGRNGDNFRDKDLQLLRVMMIGNTIIDIRVSPLIIVTFSLPPMTVDQFFGDNIVQNLAAFLGLDSSRIKITNIVEQTRRKKRSNTGVTLDVEISSEPDTVLNDASSEQKATEILDASSNLVAGIQEGTLGTKLGVEILSATITEPEPRPGTEGWADYAANNNGSSQPILIPDRLMLTNDGEAQHETAPFAEPITIVVVDASGDLVTLLRSTAQPWEIRATLRAGSGTDSSAMLLGNTTIPFRQGRAEFSTLSISHAGSGYMIDFQVVDPASAENFTIEAGPFTVTPRVFDIEVRNVSGEFPVVEVNSNFTVLAQVIDPVTLLDAENINWKGHTWRASIGVASGFGYSGSVTADLANADITADGFVTIPNVILDTVGSVYLEVSLISTPPGYNIKNKSMAVSVHTEGYWDRQNRAQRNKQVTVAFEGDYAVLRTAGHEQQLVARFYNRMASKIGNVEMKMFETYAGSIIIEFQIAGVLADLDSATDAIYDEMSSGFTISIGGQTYTATANMTVDGTRYESNNVGVANKGMSTGVIVAIVCVTLIVLILIIFLLVWLLVLRPKTKTTPGEESSEDPEKKAKTPRANPDDDTI